MNLGRILILVAAAAGATWATEQVVQRAARDGVPVLMQVEAETTAESAGAPPTPDGNTPAPDPVPEISAEEMDAELARIEAAVAGADGEDLEEFTPSKPLAADLAIALPSDF